jgi:hypothetical protein
MKLIEILPHLSYQFSSEHDLVKAVEELSRKFTTERESINDYLRDERLSSAYTAFYLATNVAKLEAVFQWLPEEFLAALRGVSLVDVGAGPGTFSIAFRRWLGAPLVNCIQVETSQVMRHQAQRLWKGLFPDEALLSWERPLTPPQGPTLMIFGHSANEMGSERALSYIQHFSPDHVLFLEPGTKDFFPQMLSIREELFRRSYQVLYPCPTGEACPLRNSHQDWCHQFLHVQHDPEVERLSQMVRKDRRLMPITFHAFSKTFTRQNPQSRIIRVLPETKFSFEWELCETNRLQRVQVMKRGMQREQEKTIGQLLAGASVELEIEKELEQSKRVKVIKINN